MAARSSSGSALEQTTCLDSIISQPARLPLFFQFQVAFQARTRKWEPQALPCPPINRQKNQKVMEGEASASTAQLGSLSVGDCSLQWPTWCQQASRRYFWLNYHFWDQSHCFSGRTWIPSRSATIHHHSVARYGSEHSTLGQTLGAWANSEKRRVINFPVINISRENGQYWRGWRLASVHWRSTLGFLWQGWKGLLDAPPIWLR